MAPTSSVADPDQVQHFAETAFGRRHDFQSIDSFSGFQKQVPITEYEDIEPYIEASRHGQPAQLTRARPVFYAMTSGTTCSTPKTRPTRYARRSR
jgi:hypothetical protein